MMNPRAALKTAWDAWERFWFAPQDLLPLGVFRFLFGLNLLIMYGLRQFDLKLYYTDAGVLKDHAPLELLPEFFRPAIKLYPLITTAPVLWHLVFLIAILLLALGVFGRVMAFVALVLHLAFMQRNVSTVYGADIVTSFWLFFLALGENDRGFSLREMWRSRRDRAVEEPDWFSNALSGVSVRLLQIQLCIIYGYTGLEKLKGATWWDGTAVWSVLGNNQLMLVDLSFLREFPVVIGLMSHTALLFEIYFPALIWMKKLKRPVLIYGCILHLGIAAAMGLFFFSGAMMAAYAVFLNADRLRARLLRHVPSTFVGSRPQN